jgi:GT2 family glycosyltransferase
VPSALRWDVVVVDNDGSDATQAAFASATGAGYPVPIRMVREQVPGAAHARNRGMTEATGEVIVFLDDDVVPRASWLDNLVDPILAGRCEGTGGRVVLDPDVTRPAWFNEGRLAGYLAAFDLGADERDIEPDGYVLTANAAFSANHLRATGGIHPALGPRSGTPLVNDDVQLCRAIMSRGGRLRYVPDAVVVHDLPAARLTRRYIARRLYAQGRSDRILERVHPLDAEGSSIGRRLGKVARSAARQGIWRRWILDWLADEVAYTAGYVRESAADFATRARR